MILWTSSCPRAKDDEALCMASTTSPTAAHVPQPKLDVSRRESFTLCGPNCTAPLKPLRACPASCAHLVAAVNLRIATHGFPDAGLHAEVEAGRVAAAVVPAAGLLVDRSQRRRRQAGVVQRHLAAARVNAPRRVPLAGVLRTPSQDETYQYACSILKLHGYLRWDACPRLPHLQRRVVSSTHR